jgi:anti-sigma factor RsiW
MSTDGPRIQRLSAEQRDNLVAYLDGELDEPNAQEIEGILARNPVARNDVEMLMRTWELLDNLPRAAATEEFTQKTLSTLKTIDVTQPITEKPWFDKVRQGVIVAGWLGGLALSGLLGFMITNQFIPNETRKLVDDLPVIENLHKYVEVDNINFLEQLRLGKEFSEPRRMADH